MKIETTGVRGPLKGKRTEAWEPVLRGVHRRCDDVKSRGAVSEDSVPRATEQLIKALLLPLTLPSPYEISEALAHLLIECPDPGDWQNWLVKSE